MRYWLAKSEPSTYSWERFLADGRTVWDGVRNAQARNHLAAMKKGDRVLFYHSGDGKAVVGIASVVRSAYPDPTSADPRWLAVDLAPLRVLEHPVTLSAIKAVPSLRSIALVRQSRLSVMQLGADEFAAILAIAEV
ncbi:MAG: EVE domain-containing protein [Deltaproteobacteria bacterium]|nr:EVE domain-containing protein [Deltaproteobacteria bacterium]